MKKDDTYGFTQKEIEDMMYDHPKFVRDLWLHPEEDIWDKLCEELDK